MQKKRRHLRAEDRGVIYRMNKAGKTQPEIAEAIDFSQRTVSKEVKRNSGKRGCREKQAEEKAAKRKKAKASRSLVIVGRVKELVDGRLALKHSPEQISGSLARKGIRTSHDTICKHIAEDRAEGAKLNKNLRINGKRCYRKRFGDREVDLSEGAKGSDFLLSLYGRKSRLGKLVRLEDKPAEGTAAAIIVTLCAYKVEPLTYGNGLEFSRHAEVSHAMSAQGYFCGHITHGKKAEWRTSTAFCGATFPREATSGKELNFQSPSELETKLAA